MADKTKETVDDILKILGAKTGQTWDHLPQSEKERLIAVPPVMITDAEQGIIKLLLADGNFLNLHVKLAPQ